jgi:hypothetical protein
MPAIRENMHATHLCGQGPPSMSALRLLGRFFDGYRRDFTHDAPCLEDLKEVVDAADREVKHARRRGRRNPPWRRQTPGGHYSGRSAPRPTPVADRAQLQVAPGDARGGGRAGRAALQATRRTGHPSLSTPSPVAAKQCRTDGHPVQVHGAPAPAGCSPSSGCY